MKSFYERSHTCPMCGGWIESKPKLHAVSSNAGSREWLVWYCACGFCEDTKTLRDSGGPAGFIGG